MKQFQFKVAVINLLLLVVFSISVHAQEKKKVASNANVPQTASTVPEFVTGSDRREAKKEEPRTANNERIISQQLLDKYAAVYPDYLKKVIANGSSYIDNNSPELIVSLHKKFNIVDEQIEKYLESKMTPEEKKMAKLKMEEEAKQKANQPEQVHSEQQSIITE